MLRMHHITLALVSAATTGGAALAATGFAVSTDRTSYTGAVTYYSTLADAQSGANAVSGPHPIPNRATASPFDTGYRDAGMYFVDNYGAFDVDSNILLTAWWYTTQANTNGRPMDDPAGDRYYSGWGNPNNSNTGFMQLYDDDGSTDTFSSAAFSNFDGAFWTDFSLNVQGSNAGADDYARLWHAPSTGGAASLTAGAYLEYELDLTFGGLEGAETSPGIIEAFNHPTSVSGSFTAIFENTNTTNSAFNGFYVVEFTFGMDNWGFGQGDAALNGDFYDSYFATVPAPGALALLGLAGVMNRRRRRIA